MLSELGFSTKSLTELILGEVHEPVGARVLDGHQRERRARAAALVLGDLRGQVDVRQDVPVEHQEALVEHRLGELQRTGRAARVGLLDEAQADPEPRAVARARCARSSRGSRRT